MLPLVEGARFAVGTLTAIPVKAPRADPDGALPRSTVTIGVLLFPLVGLGIGLIAAGSAWVVRFLTGTRPWGVTERYTHSMLDGRIAMSYVLASAVAIAVVAGLTRGLHLDGLADTADGLGARVVRQRRLEIMKNPGTGAFAVVVVSLTLLLQVCGLAVVTSVGNGTAALVVGCVASRLSIVWSCRLGVPTASARGLGAGVVGAVRTRSAVALTLITIALCGLGVSLDDDRSAWESASASAAVIVALLAGHWLRRKCIREFGGVTGDVLGAGVEVSLLAALLTMALA